MQVSKSQHSNVRRYTETYWFVFKGEDYNQDAVEIGPLFVCSRGGQVRSNRYVTIAEAREIARRYGAALIES
jgi:hypothetical protein